MEHNFSVTLVSNQCMDFFPYNTSYMFANKFSEHINLCGYEVALVSLTYYDRFQRKKDPVLEPPPEETPVIPKQFFNLDKNEHKFIVEKLDFIETKITKSKTESEFVAFMGHVNDVCFEKKLFLNFTLNSNNGVITSITAECNPPEGYHIQLSESFASVLGFSDNVFPSGRTTATAAPDLEAFDNISTDTVVGSIYIAKRKSVELSLPQLQASPNLSSIISSIVLTMRNAGLHVNMLLKKSSKSIVWDSLGDLRIQLSHFLNSYLGQNQSFIFENDGSFTVSESIIKPPKPVDEIPEPGVPPPAECSKILVVCNLLKPEWYAGTLEKILSVLERDENPEFTRIHYTAKNLIYKPVDREFTGQISIGLLGDNKSFLDPYSSPNVCVLHFKKRFVV